MTNVPDLTGRHLIEVDKEIGGLITNALAVITTLAKRQAIIRRQVSTFTDMKSKSQALEENEELVTHLCQIARNSYMAIDRVKLNQFIIELARHVEAIEPGSVYDPAGVLSETECSHCGHKSGNRCCYCGETIP